MALRLGIVADPHVSLGGGEAAWHNAYRLADSAERLDAALADPLLADVDVFALLGDLAHFGDRDSIRRCIDAVDAARRDRPAVLLGGNHDVLDPDVHLDDELAPWADGTEAAACFEAAGLGLQVQHVVALTSRPTYPFDVDARSVVPAGPAGHVVLTHFPLLSLRRPAREAGLLYSGHLADLALPVAPLPSDGPVVVLSGHLHLRGVTAEGAVLQLAFAALVEAPYELARVTVDATADGLEVTYRCGAARPCDVTKVPVVAPPEGCWRVVAGQGWHQSPEGHW